MQNEPSKVYLQIKLSFTFSIVDMYLIVAMVEGPRLPSDYVYYLDLKETRLQTSVVNGNEPFQQQNFDVSPSTYALTAAFGDTRSGTDSRLSSAKFKFGLDAVTGALTNE